MMRQKTILLTTLIEQLKQDVAPEMKINDYFEIFSNEQILKEYDLSYEEIMKGTIGNGGDGGIDGIFIFANEILLDVNDDLPKFRGELTIDLFIIQSKNKTSFDEEVLNKFIASANDVFALEKEVDSLHSVYNSELLSHVEKFRKLYMDNLTKQPQFNINYYYSSKGIEIHNNVHRKVEQLKDVILKYFDSSNFEFNFVTADKLLDLARTRKKETFSLKISESPIGTDDGGYICLVRLDEYFKLITDDDKQIQKYMFDANVRDYQGSIVVNKSIANSLLNEKNYEFWWLNNGVTILTENASVASKILTITSPQIVNGCQTSYEIYSYFKKHSIKEDNRNITIRVIKTSDDTIRARIIQSTNSQTSIPPAVLSATDPLHRNIEEYLKHYNLYYDRRKNYWKNEKKPIKDIVTIASLAQAFKSMIAQEPHISRSKPSSLVKNDEDYKQIFNNEYELESYYKIILIQRRIEALLSETDYFEKGDILNIRYSVQCHFVLKNRKNKLKTFDDIKAYLIGFNSVDYMGLEDNNVKESIRKVHQIYIDKGRSDSVAKAKYFTEAVVEDAMV